MTVRSAGDEQVFRDLLVGEVWLASGQSNMQFSLGACAKRLTEEPCSVTPGGIDEGDEQKSMPRPAISWVVPSPS